MSTAVARPKAKAGAVVIRSARPSDLKALWTLLRELAVYEKLEQYVTGSAEGLAANLFGRAWPAVDCLVASVGGRLVGYALFYGCFSTFSTRPLMYLEDIYVREAHRGRGIGRSLMSAVAKVAVERGCTRLDWAVLDWNSPSIEFYENLGAKRHGGWYTYRLSGEELKEMAEPRAHSDRKSVRTPPVKPTNSGRSRLSLSRAKRRS